MKGKILDFLMSNNVFILKSIEGIIGCSVGTISKWVNGDRDLPEKWVIPLQLALEKFGFEANDKDVPTEKKENTKIEKQTIPEKSFEVAVKTNLVPDEYPIAKSTKLKLRRTAQQWVELRMECPSDDEYAEWLKDLEEDEYLTTREKQLIKETK